MAKGCFEKKKKIVCYVPDDELRYWLLRAKVTCDSPFIKLKKEKQKVSSLEIIFS